MHSSPGFARRLLTLGVLAAVATAQTTTRVSLSSTGGETDDENRVWSMSPDARFVVFDSWSSIVTLPDAGFDLDVFVRDVASGTTTRASLGTGGYEPDEDSSYACVSPDGRYVVFASAASNLAPGNVPPAMQVYRRDMSADSTLLVSEARTGGIANGGPTRPFDLSADGNLVFFQSNATNLVDGPQDGRIHQYVRDVALALTTRLVSGLGGALPDAQISGCAATPDGRFAAFESEATNLVAGDANARQDVFLVDRVSGVVTLVSTAPGGAQANGTSFGGQVSDDARLVLFGSTADNLVAGDTNATGDIFVRDMVTGAIERVSLDRTGGQLPSFSTNGLISGDGRYALFSSAWEAVVPGDHNDVGDAYVRDRLLQRTTRISVSSSWVEGSMTSVPHAISSDARYVLFSSNAGNLVPGDTNGLTDAFLRDRWQAFPADADGDGWGDASVTSPPGVTPPLGYTDIPFDCDDTRASAHPDALELCNGIDDDCDQQVDEPYELVCQLGPPSTVGCTGTITATGTPSISATSGYVITVAEANGARSGAIVYSLGPGNGGWGWTARCIALPFQRTPPMATGGTAGACNGTLVLDWVAYVSSHPTSLGQPMLVGQAVYAQGVYRAPAGYTGLFSSDALRFATCP